MNILRITLTTIVARRLATVHDVSTPAGVDGMIPEADKANGELAAISGAGDPGT